jgi:acyl dehydratase
MPPRVINGIEELKGLVGQAVGQSDWFLVSPERIRAFAEVTEDRQWLHLDAARARTELPQGVPIAHGFLTLSLLSHLHSHAVQVRGDFRRVINYGLNRVRFPHPVPAGARIRAHSTLHALEELPGAVQLTWAITVECEGQPKPALVAEWIVRLYHDP